MTRPIVWAAGTFVGLALAASFAGERLARLSGGGPAPSASRATSAPPAQTGSLTVDRTVTVLSDRSGHFTLEGSVDGQWITMMVDTGASIVALTAEDAARAGIRPAAHEFNRSIATANGTVSVAPVRIRELRVGAISLRDVDAVVIPAGRLGVSLLGMSFLRRLQGFDIANGRLTLRG